MGKNPHIPGSEECETRFRHIFDNSLRVSEANYRLLFENMLEGFSSCRMIFDAAGRPVDFVYLAVNRVFEELTGLQEVVGKRVTEVIPGIGETNPELLERYGRVAMSGEPERFETFVPPLATWFSVSVYSVERGCFVTVFSNITARKHAEASRNTTIDLLRICNEAGSSVELMRTVALYLQEFTRCEGIGVRLRKGDDFPYFETRGFPDDFVRAENSLCRHDGAGNPDHAGHPVLECMCGNILEGRFDPARPFFTPGGSFWSSCTTELLAGTTEAERMQRTRNRCNGEGYESVALVPLRTQGKVFGLIQFNDRQKGRFNPETILLLESLVNYVAIALAKLLADEALRESTERFRMLFEHSIDAIILTNTDGSILAVNPEACRVFGMGEEEIRRAGRAGLVDSTDARSVELMDRHCGAGRCRCEITMVRGNGSPFPAEISSAVFADWDGVPHTSLIIRDVTERKNLENQLRQAQKMEAVGTLAGGIAHDFNNILTAITGYCTLLQMETTVSGREHEYLDNLQVLVDRAATLTRGLLAFSRNQVMKPKPVNLSVIVANITRLINRLLGENIAMELELSASPLTINADCGQIEQVLVNLATNARDAMDGGGTLRIATAMVHLEQETRMMTETCPPGPYALLTVSDTGQGMDEATMARIFEPFYTTKELGRGTGLGLSMLFGIVKQHHGFIRVASTPGCGATFSIYLPISPIPESGDPPEPPLPVAGNGETILIAEDDPAIRIVISDILQQFGYRVIEAADGNEAVARFRDHAPKISLAIIDALMPGQNGKEAFAEMAGIAPGVKALFVSGYPADIVTGRGLLPEGVPFLAKPISPLELLAKIRQLLDGEHPAPDAAP